MNSPARVVLPSATSNSLNSGTSIAATVNPKHVVVTKNGIIGSTDSSEPGLATRIVITVYRTAGGRSQLPINKAAEGCSPPKIHTRPPMPAATNSKKLVHWYSKRPLIRIR